MNPRVTVILPVLNGMPYLQEALASLQAQVFRDFYIILWDNGSTDGTVEEARQWIPSRLPGRVVTGEPLPLHLCLARMVGEATTPLIARMDADDLCLPHRLERQVRFLEENPGIALVGCQIECIDQEGGILPRERWAEYPVDHLDIVTQMLFMCPFCHPGILFRAATIVQIGNYQVASPVEDLDLYLRLVQAHLVANLPTVELHYRIHPKSICAVSKEGNRQADLAVATIARHAEITFGIAPATYLRLSKRTHPLTILPLCKSALYRARDASGSFINTIRSRTFLFVGRCLTGRGDLVSRLAFRMIEWFTPRNAT